jgi:pSer/pThr/pTyr-binding forkhead associated (FHA) protein
MIKCQFCQATHVDNTIFCGECGGYLLKEQVRETDALDTDEIGWEGGVVNNSGLTSVQEVSLAALRLKIGSKHREVEVTFDKLTYILGRVDPISNVFPEIDLSADGELAKSVSRRHARILKQRNKVLVEDLGSINGTFINGKKLVPYLPETLSDGDLLQLGKLPVEIRIYTQ